MAKAMTKKTKIAGGCVGLGLAVLAAAIWYLHNKNFEVLNPAGTIAAQQRHLLEICLLLSALIVIPVFTLTFMISWRYREGNTKARKKYQPEWDGSRILETVWWLIPTAIIVVIAGLTWQSSHELDPFKQLVSDKQPLKIQVVALDWKWLFIYPEQHVATVNYVEFPENTPLDFQITADAPMNSFWIPQLGGQIYAMAGMSTQMHLMANKTGDFRGSSANISGKGFADMIFMAQSRSQDDFNQWLKTTQKNHQKLDQAAYDKLAQPATSDRQTYGSVENNLYDKIVLKYMGPSE
jgi:cytochrome o ubiquinol oxidase subunit 2